MKAILISTDESTAGMGVRALSSCLIDAGFETTIVIMPTTSQSYNSFVWQNLFNLCKDALFVGISCMTHGVQRALEINNALKNCFDFPIIIGGIHASFALESLINEFQYVCLGEGEDVVVEIAKSLSNKQPLVEVPGLWIRTNDGVAKNPAKKLEKLLQEYPFPDYDLRHQFILDNHRLIPVRHVPWHIAFEYFVILGSRGCPHHCAYCCNHRIKADYPWRKEVRHYSVDNLISHLTYAMEIPEIKSFWIDDDTFFSKSMSDISEFAEKYKTKIGKPFLILISPWTFNEAKLQLLVDAGMGRIIMGIQTGSENTARNIYSRNISTNKIMQISQSLAKYSNDTMICYDFIGMNPFETSEDLFDTIKLIRDMPYPFFIYNNNLDIIQAPHCLKKQPEGYYSRFVLNIAIQKSAMKSCGKKK